MRLYRNENEFFLRLGDKMTEPLSIKDVRYFLRHYSDPDYHSELEKKATLEVEACACYEMLASVDSGYHLCVIIPELMDIALSTEHFPYITTDEFAEKYNRKKSIVLRLCRDGRLKGAIQVGTLWLIPEDTPYPADARVGARVPSSRITKPT